MWQNYTNALLGIVLFIVAFFGLSGTAALWTLASLGVAIAIIGLWGAGVMSSSSEARHA